MTDRPASWYIQTDNGPQGPYPENECKRLACLGVLMGTSLLSAAEEGPWQPATGIPELQLDWEIHPENADPLPACHVLALRDWVENGEVEPYWNIVHLPTGETYDVVDALCSALLTQNKVLETRLEAFGPAANPASGQDAEMEDAVDNLLRSLEIKTKLLADANRERMFLQEQLDEEREARAREANVSRERLEELQTHLDEMDEGMASLTRNYRDLNDRFLKLKQQQQTGS